MKKITHRAGYILILTLTVLSLILSTTTYLAYKGFVFFSLARIMTDKEKAEKLALSGIQCAYSQLMQKIPQDQATPEKTDKDWDNKMLLKTLLPRINQWQEIVFTHEKDGVDGKIKICISSEDGKININDLYDFEKKIFFGENSKEKTDYKKITSYIFSQIQLLTNTENLFVAFEKFLKERHSKLDDVTELLTIKEFRPFRNRVFYAPSDNESLNNTLPIYLTDIFTVWTKNNSVQPWLFSYSLQKLYSLKQIFSQRNGGDSENIMNMLIKNFNSHSLWKDSWNRVLLPLYGKRFEEIPNELTLLLAPRFSPTVFSVLSYGIVGKITVRLFAIIERSVSQKKNTDHAMATIKKIYTL